MPNGGYRSRVGKKSFDSSEEVFWMLEFALLVETFRGISIDKGTRSAPGNHAVLSHSMAMD